MNDDRRREIERIFDGEAGGPADDPEAQAYLRQLAALRSLSRQHDPASRIPRQAPRTARTPRAARRWRWLVAGAAAAVALMAWSRDRWAGSVPDSPPVPLVARSEAPRSARSTERFRAEIEFYRWANAPARRPSQAARLVLAPAPSIRRRSAADEILALELANARGVIGGDLRWIAASRTPRPSTPPASPRPVAPQQRPRASDREARFPNVGPLLLSEASPSPRPRS